jgi:DNA-binding beta-propeller fold protein YncE
MRRATLAIAIFSLVAGDHITQPHSALGKSAAAASSRAYVADSGSNTVKVIDYRPHLKP